MAIAEKMTDAKWIPVKERLPELDTYVLVTVFSDVIEIGWFNKDGNGQIYFSSEEYRLEGEEVDQISAWMPLPEPYEEEHKEKAMDVCEQEEDQQKMDGLSDEELIITLKYCHGYTEQRCTACKLKSEDSCLDILRKQATDRLQAQKLEIDQLKKKMLEKQRPNKQDIVDALKRCNKDRCSGCFYERLDNEHSECVANLTADALRLIEE